MSKHKSMRGLPFWRISALVALVAVLGSCSATEKVPEAYGVFVFVGNDWVEAPKSGSKAPAIDIPAEPAFLLHDKSIDSVTKSFAIQRMLFVRNTIDGSVSKPYGRWDFQEKFEPIDGRFLPVKGKPEMVLWKPTEKLPAGAYMLISQDQFIARKLGMTGQFQYRPFLVDAKTFEDRVEQTNMCVDRIPGSPWRSHVDKPCAPSKSAGSVSPETSPVKSATSTAPTVSTDTSSREPKSNDLQSELQAAGYVYRGWLGSGNSVNVRKCGGPSCAVVTELQPGETTNVYVKNDPASDWSAVRIVTGVSDSKKQTVVEGYMKNTVINSRLVSEGL